MSFSNSSLVHDMTSDQPRHGAGGTYIVTRVDIKPDRDLSRIGANGSHGFYVRLSLTVNLRQSWS